MLRELQRLFRRHEWDRPLCQYDMGDDTRCCRAAVVEYEGRGYCEGHAAYVDGLDYDY